MPLELIDESEIKKEKGIKTYILEKDDIDNDNIDKKTKKDTKHKILIKIVPEEDIVNCGRIKKGMTSNCVLCESLNKLEIFDKCKNKWI